uniref:Uncharacterized protein n=1 Tax=Rhizophagus irregularis (strain DAOM 181602 / DAOM 197198 / MUCL 43194) TaxID=747089 RepID=U9TC72_RHIID
MQYSNEDSRVKYSNLVTGAALAGRINRNSFQTVLATIGITNQYNLESAHLLEYNYQPIIRFHTVEHSHVIYKSENDSLKIIYNGNFSRTSKQMECAILLVLLNDIMPILEQTNFTLHVHTRYALAVLDQNEGLDVMISKVHTAITKKKFSHFNICNILKFVKERSQKVFRIIMKFNSEMTNEARKEKFANGRKEFAGLTLISKTSDQIHKDIFWPSFGNILRDFDIIVKCVACYAFVKKSASFNKGFCKFITRIYEQKKVQFVIDEAHCILAYQDFR